MKVRSVSAIYPRWIILRRGRGGQRPSLRTSYIIFVVVVMLRPPEMRRDETSGCAGKSKCIAAGSDNESTASQSILMQRWSSHSTCETSSDSRRRPIVCLSEIPVKLCKGTHFIHREMEGTKSEGLKGLVKPSLTLFRHYAPGD